MNRRGFLGSILAAASAPAIVRVGSLMPVSVLSGPEWRSYGATITRVFVDHAAAGEDLTVVAQLLDRMGLVREMVALGVLKANGGHLALPRPLPVNAGDTIVYRRRLPYGATAVAPREPQP